MESAIFGLIGVVIGACLTFVGDMIKRHIAKKKSAEYLAVRVSCLLDQFVDGCAEVVQDDGSIYGQYGPSGMAEIQVEPPTLDFSTLDVDWHSIGSKLMYEILMLPNLVEEYEKHVRTIFNFSDPPDKEEAFENRQLKYGDLGLKALNVAQSIRDEFKLPNRLYRTWDTKEFLIKEQESLLQKKIKRERRLQENAKHFGS